GGVFYILPKVSGVYGALYLNQSIIHCVEFSKSAMLLLFFIGIGVSLSKVNTDDLSQSIKNDLPKEEIADALAHEDYAYFFYKGVFENLT
ncbi:MAG: hypothetical protein M1167_07460, partial [Chloroflexi bacterium]|nr:hypothetical protein [Chloroflexota bacterium]